MKKIATLLLPLAGLFLCACNGEPESRLSIALDGASVWGGQIKAGSLMPYASGFEADLSDNRSN